MQNLVINYSRCVTAKIVGTPTVDQDYVFSEIADLANQSYKYQSIEVFDNSIITKTRSNESVINASACTDGRITLIDKAGRKVLDNHPLTSLKRNTNGGFHTLLNDIILDISKCFVRFGSVTNITTGQVVAINVYYTK